MISSVTLTTLKRVEVTNGDVYHGLRASEETYMGFGELYFSRIEYGKVKGWKKHTKFTLNLTVPAGQVRFVVFSSDTVTGLPATLVGEYCIGADKNHQRLTVPPGYWVAFQGLEESLNVIANVIPEEHIPSEAENIELAAIPYDWKIPA